jgi:hypothetical protein
MTLAPTIAHSHSTATWLSRCGGFRPANRAVNFIESVYWTANFVRPVPGLRAHTRIISHAGQTVQRPNSGKTPGKLKKNSGKAQEELRESSRRTPGKLRAVDLVGAAIIAIIVTF